MILRNKWLKFRELVKKFLEFIWVSYSTPTPDSTTQILSLMILCLVLSAGTAALLFRWLNGILLYDSQTASIASWIYMVAVFIFLFFTHPLRCAFTLMFPTLGTRQGRKLMLSMCVMIMVLYVLPNIATNIATITHLMKCTSENLAHSLLNSSELSNSIKRDMVDKVQKMDKMGSVFMEQLKHFNHSTDINVAELRESLTNLSKHVEEDFSKAKQQVVELNRLSSRIFAAVLVFYLFMDSIIYLKSYLTMVNFDNVYVTGLLKRMATQAGIQVEAKHVKNGVNSTSFRMTKQELLRCLFPILLITLYLLMTAMLILLDHVVYYLVATAGPWLSHIPSTNITMEVQFKVEYQLSLCDLFNWMICNIHEMVNLKKTYIAVVGSDTTQCVARPSKLDQSVLMSLGLLYALSYSFAFMEVYSRRLRRKVASSFFPQQEEKRIQFILEKIQTKKARQKGTFESTVKEDEETEKKEVRGSDIGESKGQAWTGLYTFTKMSSIVYERPTDENKNVIRNEFRSELEQVIKYQISHSH